MVQHSVNRPTVLWLMRDSLLILAYRIVEANNITTRFNERKQKSGCVVLELPSGGKSANA